MKPCVFPRRKTIKSFQDETTKSALIRKELMDKMIKQYSTSQGFFYSRIIQNIVEKKENDKNCIRANDIKFNDSKQHMQKYYGKDQRNQQFPQLLEYYKYYSQDSICFLNRQFAFLGVYHQKKKAVLYQQLKKQLNISDSQDTLVSVSKAKPTKKFQNVLSGLQMTKDNDQSYLIAEVLKKLVNYYGPCKQKNINKIDNQFNFFSSNNANEKHRNSYNKELQCNIINNQILLDSTNTTLRKNNIYFKKKTPKSPTHRRFGSCEVPKSALVRVNKEQSKQNQTKQWKQFNEFRQKKKIQVRRRRKSAENISNLQSNSVINNLQNYKHCKLKTEQPHKGFGSTNGNNRIVFTENNFRNKMESIRNKIKQDKQNLVKKPQTGCFAKKKAKLI